jgi:hypothetical protein
MRKVLTLAVLLAAVSLTATGQDEPPPARYGVPPNLGLFPQDTPKAALTSAVRAIEQGRTDYLAAHLIDPAFIDRMVADRARLLEKRVEADLRAVQEVQRLNPPPLAERIPADPRGFAEAVRRDAERRAFLLVTRDIRGTLIENPDHLRDLRRFAREGQITDAGETASAALRAVADRQVFFRRVGDLWYVQDRKQPEPAAGK